MKALYLADAALFLLFLFTLRYTALAAADSYEVVIGLLAFIFLGLPALVLFSLLLHVQE